MENNLVFSIPNEVSIRHIVREELNVFLQHLTLYLSEKDKPQYLNCKEVADLLCISLPTLHRWSDTGILTKYRVGRRVLFKYDEILVVVERKNKMRWKLTG
jgi:excisionase family DNA binding protein